MTEDQITFALLGTLISAVSFLAGQLQYWRARRHSEEAAGRALARLATESLNLVIERLKIRFDRTLVKIEGHTLREFRATTAIEILRDIKVGDIPVEAVDDFVQFRSALQALNLAMSSEEEEKTLPLDAYKSVYEKLLPHYQGLRATLRRRIGFEMQDVTWRPPAQYEYFAWPRSEPKKQPA